MSWCWAMKRPIAGVPRMPKYSHQLYAAEKNCRGGLSPSEIVGWVEREKPHHFRRTTGDGRRTGVLPSVARPPSWFWWGSLGSNPIGTKLRRRVANGLPSPFGRGAGGEGIVKLHKHGNASAAATSPHPNPLPEGEGTICCPQILNLVRMGLAGLEPTLLFLRGLLLGRLLVFGFLSPPAWPPAASLVFGFLLGRLGLRRLLVFGFLLGRLGLRRLLVFGFLLGRLGLRRLLVFGFLLGRLGLRPASCLPVSAPPV